MKNTEPQSNVRFFASAETGVDYEALSQLYALAKLDDVERVAGFPSLQGGSRGLRGMAVATTKRLHPHLLGNDLGCGMSVWKTNLTARDADPDAWAELPLDLETSWDGNTQARLAEHDLHSTVFDHALGTLGDGSHFAEVLAWDEIRQPGLVRRLGLASHPLMVLVHAGTAGMGYAITLRHGFDYPDGGVEAGSFGGREYLRQQRFAIGWGSLNRRIIAERLMESLDGRLADKPVWDGCHNSIEAVETGEGRRWVHRRGSISARSDWMLIAGSRGTHSYWVRPVGEGADNAWSLPHGAGRRWSRQAVQNRMRWSRGANHLLHNPLGGRVICHQREVLYGEAPENYRSSTGLVADLEQAGLIEVIASMRPVLTYQTQGWSRVNARSV